MVDSRAGVNLSPFRNVHLAKFFRNPLVMFITKSMQEVIRKMRVDSPLWNIYSNIIQKKKDLSLIKKREGSSFQLKSRKLLKFLKMLLLVQK